MTTVFDVPADLLIEKVAEEFKNKNLLYGPILLELVFTKKENQKTLIGGL